MTVGKDFVIGVDVGTGSVRAALVDKLGVIRKTAAHKLQIWNPRPDYYQQSSENIWEACCTVIKTVSADVPADQIKGLGFDATCSLVAIDRSGGPVSVSPEGEPSQNIIMWMDHRADKEAAFVNSLGHPMLRYVGGKISLEMQVPKLLWLKQNLKSQCWDTVERFFDLPDFLTWKATGCDSRSLCSVVCKWMYEAKSDKERGWSTDFYTKVGLEDLLQDNFRKIGRVVKAPGELCGGLHISAAQEFGLPVGIAVATSIIDAHAGGLGLIGCHAPSLSPQLSTSLALICGTSTCHMMVSEEGVEVPGVWGPYYGAMVPGMWLSEGGQSATGKLIDTLLFKHPGAEGWSRCGASSPSNIVFINYLNNIFLPRLASEQDVPIDLLTKNLHVWPDFHGNRSPIADPSLRGMICGLGVDGNEEHLALLYLATIQALAYGTRHIMEMLVSSGHKEAECVLACGGLSKNNLFVRSHANALCKPVLVPEREESVLLGAAMLAATAAGFHPDVSTAVREMAGPARLIAPDPRVARYHEQKYKVFKKMLDDQLGYRKIMEEV